MRASVEHFQEATKRIRQNSWFSDRVLNGDFEFTFRFDNGEASISEVPSEAFESLLLSVRKLTMNDAPEQLHKVQKVLKQSVTNDQDCHLLDAWKKYWRIAFIREPFLLESQDGSVSEVITPFRVYDAFVNGHHFHTNDQQYNTILYGGNPGPSGFQVNLFLQNLFHWTVAHVAFAALGLDRDIENGCTFANLPLLGAGVSESSVVTEFMFCRNQVSEMDEQYKIFNDWIEDHGGCSKGRWT